MKLLRVAAVSKKKGNEYILNGIGFEQEKGQKIAIAGETGSGKTTLLKIIAGLITPDEGEVIFENERVKKVPEEKLIPGHPGIAYLSQQFELPNYLRVEQVLAYSNILPETEADEIFRICQIDHLLKRRTDELSGGEKQRIALSRLLISSPRLLLLDEPYSNLDMMHKQVLKSVIEDLTGRLNISTILVSHDPLDTISWADEIIIMKGGRFVQRGEPRTVYQQPMDEYCGALLGKYTLIKGPQTSIFNGIPGIVSSGRDLFIRPEKVKRSPNPGQGLEAKVIGITYYGSYHEIELMFGEASIKANLDPVDFSLGDSVWIFLEENACWWLPAAITH